MKLLVDAGNTAIKLAHWDGEQILAINATELDWQHYDAVLVSAVRSNEALQNLVDEAQKHSLEVNFATVTPELSGVSCGYQAFQHLGIDRWLAVLGAWSLWPTQNLVVVDAGTATTIDMVNLNGEHLGGWIIPGLDLMMESIVMRAQKVFTSELIDFELSAGTDTPIALSRGCFASQLGAVNEARNLFGQNCQVVVCGGYGLLLQQHLNLAHYQPDLVFTGLIVWFKNQQN
jgi:type III pantothenate kinase